MKREPILVIGARGMLGTDLMKELRHRSAPHAGYDLPDVDITDPESIRLTLKRERPAVVVNCAAYTNVNKAEEESELALKVNGEAVGALARECSERSIRLVHISTDYVFPGTLARPFETTDDTNPLNSYGRSKLEGEKQIQAAGGDYAIIRSSWLYGANGPNFVATILAAAKGGKPLKIVADQVGAPTYTVDLARAVADIAEHSCTGILHVTNSGACSWFEFAEKIFELSGIRPVDLKPISSEDYISPAPRPRNSRLSNQVFLDCGFDLMPAWEDALRRFLHDTGITAIA